MEEELDFGSLGGPIVEEGDDDLLLLDGLLDSVPPSDTGGGDACAEACGQHAGGGPPAAPPVALAFTGGHPSAVAVDAVPCGGAGGGAQKRVRGGAPKQPPKPRAPAARAGNGDVKRISARQESRVMAFVDQVLPEARAQCLSCHTMLRRDQSRQVCGRKLCMLCFARTEAERAAVTAHVRAEVIAAAAALREGAARQVWPVPAPPVSRINSNTVLNAGTRTPAPLAAERVWAGGCDPVGDIARPEGKAVSTIASAAVRALCTREPSQRRFARAAELCEMLVDDTRRGRRQTTLLAGLNLNVATRFSADRKDNPAVQEIFHAIRNAGVWGAAMATLHCRARALELPEPVPMAVPSRGELCDRLCRWVEGHARELEAALAKAPQGTRGHDAGAEQARHMRAAAARLAELARGAPGGPTQMCV